MIVQVLTFKNHDKTNVITVVIEPWGEQFEIGSASTIKVTFISNMVESIHTEWGDDVYSIWGFDDCEIKISIDDVDCTPSSFLIPIPKHK